MKIMKLWTLTQGALAYVPSPTLAIIRGSGSGWIDGWIDEQMDRWMDEWMALHETVWTLTDPEVILFLEFVSLYPEGMRKRPGAPP